MLKQMYLYHLASIMQISITLQETVREFKIQKWTKICMQTHRGFLQSHAEAHRLIVNV